MSKIEKNNAHGTSIDLLSKISGGKSLHDFGITIFLPSERKDAQSPIHYASLGQTVQNWQNDPHSEKIFHFLSQTTGILPHDVLRVLREEAGMREYVQWRQEGRYISAFGTQVLKPTFYFLSKVIMPALLQQQFGIPTAVLIIDDPEDMFHSSNGDKITGKIEFPLGIDSQGGMERVYIETRPYAVREKDGTLRRITQPSEANGYACKDVFLQVVDAGDSHNNHFTQTEEIVGGKKVTVYYQAALGIAIPGLVSQRIISKNGQEKIGESISNPISLTDFYKVLWHTTIANLRSNGVLPSESDMPIHYVHATTLYGAIAHHARKVPTVLEMAKFTESPRVQLKELFALNDEEILEIQSEIGTNSYEAVLQYILEKRKLYFDERNGLLLHTNGTMDPAPFYIWETAWGDVDLECSSCGGRYFVGKVKRGQQIQEAYGLSHKEVRLPDTEIPELERYFLHPNGRVANIEPLRLAFNNSIAYLTNQLPSVMGTLHSSENDSVKQIARQRIDGIKAQIEIHRAEFAKQFLSLMNDQFRFTSFDVFIPPIILGLWKEYVENVKKSMITRGRRNQNFVR